MPKLISDAERRRRKALNQADPPQVLRSKGRLRPAKPKIHAALYATGRWYAIRDAHLRKHPVCQGGCGRLAKDCHHIVKHDGDPALFYDPNNIVSLCRACHDYATAYERSPAYRYPSPAEPRRHLRVVQSGDRPPPAS